MRFYRIQHPEGLGLWYNTSGEFKEEIAKMDVACKDLEMGYDEQCAGGYHSATDSLKSLFEWFSPEEIVDLQKLSYFINVYDSEDFKFCDKYNHWLFSKHNYKHVATIDI